MALLDAVLARVEQTLAAGRLPVCVFDLDSTLLSTAERHLRILREFAETYGDPPLVAAADALRPSQMGYRVDDALPAGLLRERQRDRLADFWWERFFHPDYLRLDRPTPGAVPFVRAVWDAGALVYYLTARCGPGEDASGRRWPCMRQATVHTLLGHGFPLHEGRAMLHLKPSPAVADGDFKASAVAAICALRGEVVASFENEPGHANTLARAFPGAITVLLDTNHSPGAPTPLPAVLRVSDFRG